MVFWIVSSFPSGPGAKPSRLHCALARSIAASPTPGPRMCWLETLSFSTGRNFESNAKNYHFRAAQSTCGSRAQCRRWWDVHLVLCFACSDQPRAAETSSAGSRRNLAANPSCATGGRRLRSRFHLPTVNCSWILRLHLHAKSQKTILE